MFSIKKDLASYVFLFVCLALTFFCCSASTSAVYEESFEDASVGGQPLNWEFNIDRGIVVSVSDEQASDGSKSLLINTSSASAIWKAWVELKQPITRGSVLFSFDVNLDQKVECNVLLGILPFGPNLRIWRDGFQIRSKNGFVTACDYSLNTWYRVQIMVPDLRVQKFRVKIEELGEVGKSTIVYDEDILYPFAYDRENINGFEFRLNSTMPKSKMFIDNVKLIVNP